MIAEGARLKDRYLLERLLGRGGMAAVWLAQDEVLERPVAIKVLSDTIASDPEFLARFRREARVAAGLSHPNLIGVYDYAEGDERPYLVMEYVAGETLAERMARKAEIDCGQLARELLSAVAHIHAAGIVHRDVKPQNVLIAPDGSAKLIDFGIALPRDATALTRTGHLLGTARYIAPEVMAGKPATERSDLFSCGVVLRDCLGSRPPSSLRALVARLSTEDVGGRPASAQEALLALDRKALAEEQHTERFTPTFSRPPAQAPTESSTRRLRQPRSRAPLRRAAAVLSILAAAAVAFLVLTDSSSDRRDATRDARAGGGAKVAANDGGSADAAAAAGARAADEPSAPADEASAAAEAEAPAPEGDDVALGSALNQEGFDLIQSGSYEEAVPVLEEAIRAFPPGTEDLSYAYALFNLGNALRLSGRPEDAIPVLQQRLEIPNQTGTVREELAAAESEAGL
jgi:serine/threonine-protein kinase